MARSSNNPPVLVELDSELAAFVIENCDANMRLALSALQAGVTRESAEKLVALNDKFKRLREAVLKGRA